MSGEDNSLAKTRISAWGIDALFCFGLMILLGSVAPVVVIGYVLMRDYLFEGQSLGKRIMGIAVVVGPEARRCTLSASVLRNLLWVIPVLQVVMGLTGLHELFHNAEGRHWGDRLADSRVVRLTDPHLVGV